MKDILLKCFTILFLFIVLTGCQGTNSNNDVEEVITIVVGATPIPHADILNAIKEDLLEENIRLEVKEFSDYFLLNQALVEGNIDANFFQHIPFLDSYIESSGNKLISLGEVHIEPMGAYSSRVNIIEELEPGSLIAIPNDPSNGARALLLLEENGLIKLGSNSLTDINIHNISENPLNLKIREVNASQIPRVLRDVDLAIINTNIALLAGLLPKQDALIIESNNSKFANIVAVRQGDEKRQELQSLINALQSDTIRSYIKESYGGNIVPAF